MWATKYLFMITTHGTVGDLKDQQIIEQAYYIIKDNTSKIFMVMVWY